MSKRFGLEMKAEVIVSLGDPIILMHNGRFLAEFEAGDYRKAGERIGHMISETLSVMADEGCWRLECKFEGR